MKRYTVIKAAVHIPGGQFVIIDHLYKCRHGKNYENENEAVAECIRLNRENIIEGGRFYNGFYIKTNSFICTCGAEQQLKELAQSGRTSCRHCGRFLPRHILLVDYNNRKKEKKNKKAHPSRKADSPYKHDRGNNSAPGCAERAQTL